MVCVIERDDGTTWHQAIPDDFYELLDFKDMLGPDNIIVDIYDPISDFDKVAGRIYY